MAQTDPSNAGPTKDAASLHGNNAETHLRVSHQAPVQVLLPHRAPTDFIPVRVWEVFYRQGGLLHSETLLPISAEAVHKNFPYPQAFVNAVGNQQKLLESRQEPGRKNQMEAGAHEESRRAAGSERPTRFHISIAGFSAGIPNPERTKNKDESDISIKLKCRWFGVTWQMFTRVEASIQPTYVVVGIFRVGQPHPHERVVFAHKPEQLFSELHWGCHHMNTAPRPRLPSLKTALDTCSAISSSSIRITGMDIKPRFPRLLDQLQKSDYWLWGFVIYRCTYDDNSAWARFLAILNERTRVALEEELAFCSSAGTENGDAVLGRLIGSLRWDVRDDRALFDGASKVTVCGKPVRYLDVGYEGQIFKYNNPRYRFAVHVDEEVLDSVVNWAPRPPDSDNQGVGSVVLIDSTSEVYTTPQNGSGKFSGDVDSAARGGEPPVEGCTSYEVGWMRVGVGGLVPGLYAALLESDFF
ncbi:hypothetical protein GQX73_g7284 [Xylaria multiplex]|uniref:Uncharacterized protein n=1 Tax=Xylaria multiplex TaxID=323545 RepID=A0A7C8MM15_9PEZI|nr:hypothetical protein GQX73_g7284 [Xylaria multiplex]